MKTSVVSSEALRLFPAASVVDDSVIDDRQSGEEEAGDVDPLSENEAEPASAPLSTTQAARIKALVMEHHAFVWRSLVRLGVPRADAEDAVQQVFMVTSRRIDDISHGSDRSFLYGVCLRVASRARRTLARRREVLGDEACPERVDPGTRADDLIDRARARALLDEILSTMPLELRSVFTLFELEQMTMIQIAGLLELPQGTVASRLRRARELFVEQRNRIEARLRGGAASQRLPLAPKSGIRPALKENA
ncbi:MAG: sigma-70 family RNA polymerase sigma factor [Myxococcales bacterium]|nr:sigma-70 family RNA polymerase sigma factor [Myxococcales bacterium]